jgi:hypothetical protein
MLANRQSHMLEPAIDAYVHRMSSSYDQDSASAAYLQWSYRKFQNIMETSEGGETFDQYCM